MQSTESGRKINHAVNSTSKAVGKLLFMFLNINLLK